MQPALQRVVDLGADPQALRERRRADRDHHELLEVDAVVGVRAAVQHVHHRDGEDVRLRAAEIPPQRLARPRQRPPWPPPARLRGSRWRRAGPCWECRRGRSAPGRAPAGRRRPCRSRRPRSRRSRVATARVTPLPFHSVPPSRSSTASNSPVEAPDGHRRAAHRPRLEHHVGLDGRDCPASRGSAGRAPARSCSSITPIPGRARRVALPLGLAAQGDLRIDVRVLAPASRRPTAGCRSRRRRARRRGASALSPPPPRALPVRFCTFAANSRPGRFSGTVASGSAASADSPRLISSQLALTSEGVRASVGSSASAASSPKTCGWRRTSLRTVPSATAAEVAVAALLEQQREEVDLEQHVAELVEQLGVVARVRGVGQLVGLLDRVRDDAALVLLAVPGAVAAQPPGDRIEL